VQVQQPEMPFLRVLEYRAFDGGTVFAVEGELDLGTVKQLQRPFAGICRRSHAVTVDLRRVAFVDCVGLRALLELDAEGLEHDCRVEFIQGPDAVARVFELTGTREQLAFVPSISAPPVAVSTG
jgi:anti-sigma B factor antagonist